MMKVYQMNDESVKGSVEMIDSHTLYRKASQGLLELSLSLGLEVLQQMFEEDVKQYAGERGKHKDPDRVGYRHGTEDTTVVMGGKKVRTKRPRVRATDGGELPLETLGLVQNEDPLNRAILSRLLSSVTTRKYQRTVDGDDSICTSKSEVSRRFVEGMNARMEEFLTRRIEDAYPVLMLDGIEFGKVTILAALGINSQGKKQILGIIEGGSENSEVVKGLLSDLISRGLETKTPRLCVLDGGKALHKAVQDTFGTTALIQRCQVHKKRNVLSYLPKSEQANVSMSLTLAYREFDYETAKSQMENIAANLDSRYPKAAASIREGLEETLTVHRLEIPGTLRETLCCTNAIESANSVCRNLIRKVSNFKDATMVLRHAAAGFLEAERSFRRVRGYKDLTILSQKLSEMTGTENSATKTA